jgi:DnaJ-class molecular chaperone
MAPNQNQKGHHYIKFKILVPNKLNEAQRKLFDDLSKVEDKINQNYGD